MVVKGYFFWAAVLIVLAPLAIASTAQTGFLTNGCNIAGKDIPPNSCSRDGTYFCKVESQNRLPTAYNTLTDKYACSLGKRYVGESQCCPSGYYCDSKTFVCVQRKNSCSSYKDELSCYKGGCNWIVGPDICVEGQRDFSCSFYKSQSACKKDLWNLGKLGLGTELCATKFSANYDGKREGYFVSSKNCGCVWSNNECKLSYNVSDEIYPAGSKPKSLVCEKKINAGPCLNGEQSFDVTAKVSKNSGFDAKKYSGVLSASKCVSGNFKRNCGEQIFKLPFFSAGSLVLSVIILLFYYSYFAFTKNFRRNYL